MTAGAAQTLARESTAGRGRTSPTAVRTGPRPPAVRRGLAVSAVVAALVLVFLLLAVFTAGTSGGEPLDIRSAKPQGARALAEILRARGVSIIATQSPSMGVQPTEAASTIVVLQPGRLDRDTLTGLLGQVWQGSDVVLVDADGAVLDALDVGVHPADDDPGGDADPGCALPEATVAGTVPFEGARAYAPVARATGSAGGSPGPDSGRGDMRVVLCYGDSPQAARLAVLTPDRRSAVTGGTPRSGSPGGDASQAAPAGRLVLLGSADFLTNHRLDREGSAALALGLLARHPTLIWLTPAADGHDGVDRRGAVSLVPLGVRWAVLQIAVVLILLALWRGRRLGPPVPEPLPVLVRAAESVEGHGRLYASARARDRAADALRAGGRLRLAERIGLPLRTGPAGTPEPDPVALVASVAEQTGRSPSEIGSLLYGSGMPPPLDTRPGPLGRAVDHARSRGLPPEPLAWSNPSGAAPAPHRAPTARRRRPVSGTAQQDRALMALAEALDDLDRQIGER
ncbi:DUF4350 domain-containing protein [Frankia sp. AiPs1]